MGVGTGKEETMTLRLNGNLQIENLGQYPAEWVEALRQSLARGSEVTPDPKRKHLYELQSNGLRFYIDVLPSGRKIVLLAAWPTGPAQT